LERVNAAKGKLECKRVKMCSVVSRLKVDCERVKMLTIVNRLKESL
jgi:hypothetical protein